MQITADDLRGMNIKLVMFWPVLGQIQIEGSKFLEGFVSPSFWMEIRTRLWGNVPILIHETVKTAHGPNANRLFKAHGVWVQYGPMSWIDGMVPATVKEEIPFVEMTPMEKMSTAAHMAGRVRIMAE
jgi:hypothetical protein